MNNRQVAEFFETVADMLAIRGDSIHRVLAYRRAGEAVRVLGRDINRVHADGQLTDIPGIGQTLADKIDEMLTTGRLAFYDRLAEEVPPGLVDVLRVDGVGPKKAKLFYEKLGVTSLETLAAAVDEQRLRDLPGMGEKSEARIAAAISALSRHGDDRTPLGEARPLALEILAELAAMPGVTETAVGGSLRRMRDTIGDIDLLVAAANAGSIMDAFVNHDRVETVTGHGPTKSSVVLHNGLAVDLRVLPADKWGTLLVYFTGSQAHNIRLREMALKRGYTLNEHAFTPVEGGPPIHCATEADVYAMFDLPWIAPTLREDRGEIEAARQGTLPDLITREAIAGDLHMHSTWSDGKRSILEMARAAQARGHHYVVISDHSASLGIANGLSIERLREQATAVREADAAMGPDFRVLHGTEMEIRADGALDYPDEVLAELDFVIASLHVGLNQPREQVTARALNALNNPHVDMLGHPTGRLMPDRPPADLDMDAVLETAARTGTILEINANPRRLDLRDQHVRRAVELGVRLAINTDAHDDDQLGLLSYGVATAQRGWATAADIVNSWPIDAVLDYIGRDRA